MLFFFFNDTATTEIYTLSLHDALPISRVAGGIADAEAEDEASGEQFAQRPGGVGGGDRLPAERHRDAATDNDPLGLRQEGRAEREALPAHALRVPEDAVTEALDLARERTELGSGQIVEEYEHTRRAEVHRRLLLPWRSTETMLHQETRQ